MWPGSWVIFNLHSDETTQTPSGSVFGPNRIEVTRPGPRGPLIRGLGPEGEGSGVRLMCEVTPTVSDGLQPPRRWSPVETHLINVQLSVQCVCLVAQSCTILRDPMGCSLPGFSVRGDSPGKNTDMGCHALLQGTFPTQGLNPGLPHCRWILCRLSHRGSPRRLEWVAYPFSRGSS